MKQFARISALVLAMGAALVASTGAQAASAGSTFNVNITLTPKCEIAAVSTDLTFVYTSFQTTNQAATGGGFSLKCTAGLTPSSFALDSASVTDTETQLAYTIGLPTPLIGTGSAQNYAVTGNMALGQSGVCSATAGCTNNSLGGNKQRTLTITY